MSLDGRVSGTDGTVLFAAVLVHGVLTVLIGVLVLHALLMLVALAGGLLLVDADVFEEVTGDPATLWQYLKLAWFVGGLATIGSALGAGLEEADDVREAIFTRGSR